MNNLFIDNFHKSRYTKLIATAGVHQYDSERQAFFYITSGNEDLYSKAKFIYDFNDNSILVDCLLPGNVDFCSSSRSLVRLGFNLFNGYWDYYTSPLDLLGVLDHKNLLIACNAILLRLRGFNHCFSLASISSLKGEFSI